MTKKFNLTEKIIYRPFPHIHKERVAEFIRLLKEDAYLDDDDIEWVNVERIDNLAGTAFSNHSPEENKDEK